jgi:hypothetical protein
VQGEVVSGKEFVCQGAGIRDVSVGFYPGGRVVSGERGFLWREKIISPLQKL